MKGPADALNVGRGIQNDSKICDPGSWKAGITVTEMGRMGRSRFGRKNQEFGFRPVELEMSLWSPGGGVDSSFRDTKVDFKGCAGAAREAVLIQTGFQGLDEIGE